MTRKIIKNYVAFMFLDSLAISFFFGTYQLFLTQKGLSLLEINLLNCCFMFSSFLLEIPTGAIADFLGRKRSVIIGLWFYSISFLIYFLSDNFWQFLLAEIIGAFAVSCISGALEALVVDSLNHHGYKDGLENVFRKTEVKRLAVILGVIAGSFLGQIDLSLPWLFSCLAFGLLAVSANYFFKEEYFVKPEKIKFNFEPIKKIAKESVLYGLNNRRLIVVVSFSTILAFSVQAINMYWPIIFKNNFSVPIKYMGFIFTGIILFSYLGSQFSKFWQGKINNKKNAIFLSQSITIIGILGCFFLTNLSLFFVFFFFHEFGRGLFEPLNRAYINENIDSKNRATVLSFESMITRAGAGLGLVSSGLTANNFGILNSWLISSLVLFAGILIFWLKSRKATSHN